MKKRIIASFIAIALTLSQVSAFAMYEPIHGENEETERYMRLYTDTENEFEDNDNAELFDLTSGDYKYTVNSDGTVEITDYNGTDTEITIPSEIDGKKVTSIKYMAFYGCYRLKSIEIPDGVTSIGSSAFAQCMNLERITIPNSVTSIDSYTFSSCYRLKSIEIPDSVTSIGNRAFSGTALYNNEENWEDGVLYIGKHLIEAKDNISGDYKIKSGTITIADYAFYRCSLKSVIIPDGVTSIGESTFYLCENLESIEIPDSVTSIGSGAFISCSSVKSYEVSENNQNYTSVDGALFNKEKTELIYYLEGAEAKKYTIPDSVTSIGDSAFYGCSSLESITIPDSVTNIGMRAFEYCSSLESITIPDSVTSIGSWAFNGCSRLTSIEIPDSVTSIVSSAFFGTALYNNEENWENGVLYIGKHLIDAKISGNYEIKNGTITIADYAFYECKDLGNVTIPNSVTNIGEYAFCLCVSLERITIPASVTSIGIRAFDYCSSLTSITIPDSVTSIGNYAFDYCSSLTSITIPDSVTSIGSGAFSKCSSLERITIPNSVTSIGDMAFIGCDNLTIYGYKNSYAQTYANDNNIPFSLILEFNDVTLDKPEVSYDNGKVNVKVTINTEKDSGFKVYAAAYDDNGNMIGIKEVNVSDKNVKVDAKEKPKKVKVFAFKTADGASPLCENQEITDIK